MPLEKVASFDFLRANAFQILKSKLFGYAGVSVVALGCDVAIYSANVIGHMNHTLAAAFGYVAGILVHFLLSRRLVFKSQAQGKDEALEALGFAMSGLAGLAITSSVVFVVSDVLHMGSVLAKAAAVFLSFAAVYLMRSRVVFKKEPS
jgi:putative flippase GtrA